MSGWNESSCDSLGNVLGSVNDLYYMFINFLVEVGWIIVDSAIDSGSIISSSQLVGGS